MNRTSIRFRLAAWYSAVLLVGLCAFGAIVWFSMRYSLHKDLDEALVKRARGLEQYLQIEAAENLPGLPEELQEFSEALPTDHLVQVQDPQGRPIVSAGNAPEVLVESLPHLEQAGSFGRTEWHGLPYRTFGKVLVARGWTYRLFIAVSTDAIDHTLHRLLLLLLLAIPGVVGVAAGGGLWLSRRALAPVDRMTEAARSISIDNLSARLAVPQTNDELQRLSETWNEMLDRLEGSVARMARFTADASHELRTPIALIRTSAEIALRRQRSPEVYERKLREIHAESEQMTRLVEDLMFLARADEGEHAGNMAVLDFRAPLQAAISKIRPLADAKEIDLCLELCDRPVELVGIESALYRLVLGLLENAVKYTPPNGRIAVGLCAQDQAAVLTVSDNGAGIPAAAIPHIFERFFRVDSSRNRDSGGYGLGLAIVQTIAEQHKAAITVASDSGGTTFRVQFPSCRQCSIPAYVGGDTFPGSGE